MKKLAVLGLAISVSAIALSAQAEGNEEPKANIKPAASLQIGADALDITLGFGTWNNNVHFMYYVSRFQSDDTTYVDGTDIGKTKYSSNRLGIAVNSYRMGLGNDAALKGGFFVYKNDSDLNIDRYGIGVSFSSGVMFTDKLQICTGLDLMPEFLSSDWGAKAILEYEFHTGLSYRITSIFDAGISYRMGRTYDSTNVGFYSLPMLEVSLRM